MELPVEEDSDEAMEEAEEEEGKEEEEGEGEEKEEKEDDDEEDVEDERLGEGSGAAGLEAIVEQSQPTSVATTPTLPPIEVPSTLVNTFGMNESTGM